MALNAIQRLDAEDRLMGLMQECISLGHPLRQRFLQVKLGQMGGLEDDRLTSMTDRLTVWVEAKRAALVLAAESGLTAPTEVG